MNSWEDKYHHIKSEKEELAKRFNDLNDTARLLRTKCAQLESFRKKIINGANFHAAAADAGKITTSIIDAISQPNENQQDYEDLFKCYETLQRDYRAVATKHKSSVQVITKLKKELQSLKRRYGQGPQHYRPKPTGSCAHENSKGQRKSSHMAYSDDVENVLRQLQQRLSDAEKQLLTLSAENEKLQGDGGNDDQLRVSKQSNIEEKNKVSIALSATEIDHIIDCTVSYYLNNVSLVRMKSFGMISMSRTQS